MAGFKAYNAQSVVCVDSSLPYTRASEVVDIGSVSSSYYSFPNPYVGPNAFGAHPSYTPLSNILQWFRLNAGYAAFPTVGGLMANSGRLIKTTRTQPVEAGYLNVRDEQGNLVWSALSAGKTPRVGGVLRFDSTTPLDTQDVSFTFSQSPYLLLNNFMGEVSDDGETVAWSGLIYRWTGTQLQFRWIQQKQATFAAYAANRGGIHIPYAYFTGYN